MAPSNPRCIPLPSLTLAVTVALQACHKMFGVSLEALEMPTAIVDPTEQRDGLSTDTRGYCIQILTIDRFRVKLKPWKDGSSVLLLAVSTALGL